METALVMLSFAELQSEECTPQEARDLLYQVVSYIPADKFRDAQMVISELATNALVHGPTNGTILLRLEVFDNALRGVVCDEGSGFKVPIHPVPNIDRTGGFGLVIVDRLCSTWGVAAGEDFGISFEIRW